MATASPHPNAMTIHPPFWAFEWLSNTAATTPSPKRIRIPVPTISATKMLSIFPLSPEPSLDGRGARLVPPRNQAHPRSSQLCTGGEVKGEFLYAIQTRILFADESGLSPQ